NNKLDTFLGECVSGNFKLTAFLEKNINNYSSLDIFDYSIKTYSDMQAESAENIEIESDNKELNDIQPFIKSSNRLPYIPGSSIKGAIRTAIIYGEVMNNKEKYVYLFRDILKTEKKYNFRDIESDILKKKLNLFKNMSISDTNEAELDNLYISQRYDVVTSENTYHPLPIFLEVLKPGVKLYFTLSIDKPYSIYSLLKYFSGIYNNKEDNTFYSDYLTLSALIQENILDKYPLFDDSLNMTPNIFIGGVNGFLTKSIIYSIRKTPNYSSAIKIKELVNYIKKYLDYQFYDKENKMPKGRHVILDDKISPRSLRLVKKDEDNLIALGMCNIKVEEELC
ncbi:type III-A CRISPR-associated RAMP protein Csm5, partial [Brachyspira innocens]|uniref:type III-A CRISPR-associated RAMP protein Csm5 n=1 Tax=Brachyspira innocens TaxID=13264 RepID=UPI0026F27FA6